MCISVNCDRNQITLDGQIVQGTRKNQTQYHPIIDQISNVNLCIETDGRPIAQRSRRLAGNLLKSVKAEFDTLLKEGII